jgi:hypothetical protein
MKLQKIAVWGFLFAGVLGTITGLRDTFAPGFFNASPQVKGTSDIILQFVSAAAFLALAYLLSISPQVNADKKR